LEETPFGRYRLRDLLGRGGMGEVWRAYDTATNRVVALKVLLPHSADDEEFQRRFRREAEVAAGLSDPHVVPIHDYGEIDGRLYVNMRLIDGRDLGEVLRVAGGRLPPARAVHLLEQVAEALEAAHAVGLVHRDIKPSNILVTPRDFVYLIDFGIARASDQTRLTSTGVAVGTFAYMSPERFETTECEPNSDIYALTCVLYETLTGQLPFPGDSLPQQIAAHITKPPPAPTAISPDVSQAFDAVIAKGMAKLPSERFQTTTELAEAARAALDAPTHPEPPKPLPPPVPHQLTPPRVEHPPTVPLPVSTQRPPPPHTPAPNVAHPPTVPRPVSAAFDPAYPEHAQRTAPEHVVLQRKPINRRLIILAAVGLVVLVIIGLIGGRWIIRSNYYVAAQDGRVLIMRGVPGSVLGIPLQGTFEIVCLEDDVLHVIGVDDDRSRCQPLKVDDLNESGQRQVDAGLPAGSLDNAIQQLDQLFSNSLLPLCPPPNPTPTPTPTTVPSVPPVPMGPCRLAA
jgi:serine/threonine-protein kinase